MVPVGRGEYGVKGRGIGSKTKCGGEIEEKVQGGAEDMSERGQGQSVAVGIHQLMMKTSNT